MIAVLDYGAGNLRSVSKALEAAGAQPVVTSDAAALARAGGLVVPGQGSAVDAMRNLERLGLVEPITAFVASGRPFLGVCLGEQIIFESSEEGGQACLGLLAGTCRRLPGGQKVPHMGWNSVDFRVDHPLLAGIPSGSYFYFVHSYYVDPADPAVVVGETDYGVRFASIVAQGNVFATQFHPEKSSDLGLQIYRNFVTLCEPRSAPVPLTVSARV
ncbi:MAG: imidazole glycerol phosphate synthase subunit HisH [Chloroflexota bacterium]|nr:imidazole glycerol phosphate synthase subunit HisH [Chloroflexota bacterium]